MHVAASTRCFADQSLEQACSSLWDLEFKHLELSVDGSQLTLDDVASGDEFAARCRSASRATVDSFGLLTGPTADQMQAICKTAKLMQVTHISVPSSEQGTPFNEEIDRLQTLVKIALVDGLRVSIATDPGTMTQDPHTAVELCQQVRGLGLTYDPSHYIVSGQVVSGQPSNLDQIVPHIFHVRLRDTSPQEFQVSLGLGENDFFKLIGELEGQRYDQGLTIDLVPGQFEGEDRMLEMRKMRRLLETQL